MKRYLITNPAFTGEAVAIYNPNGLLMKLDVSGTDMNESFIEHFKKSVPAHFNNLETAFRKDTVIVESEMNVTFEQFWVKYNHKFNKPRAESLWDRLSKTDKILAYFGIDKYHKYLRKHSTQAKMHPDTYVRTKAWLNDYN